MSDTDPAADEVSAEDIKETLARLDLTIEELREAVAVLETVADRTEPIEAELATLRELSDRFEARLYADEGAATQDGEDESVASEYLDLEQPDLADGDDEWPAPEQYDPVDEDALQAAVDAREDAVLGAMVALEEAQARLQQVIERLETE